MRTLCFALLLLTAPLAANAQDSASKPTVERTERLLVLLGTREAFDGSRAQLLKGMMQNPLVGQHVDLVEEFFLRVAPYDSVHAAMVEVHRQRLSPTQVEALISFYETPANKDVALLLGRINLEVSQLLSDRVAARLPELTQALLERLQKP